MSESFVFGGATYTLNEPQQLIQISGPWPKGWKLFKRRRHRDRDTNDYVNESAADLLRRIEQDALDAESAVSCEPPSSRSSFPSDACSRARRPLKDLQPPPRRLRTPPLMPHLPRNPNLAAAATAASALAAAAYQSPRTEPQPPRAAPPLTRRADAEGKATLEQRMAALKPQLVRVAADGGHVARNCLVLHPLLGLAHLADLLHDALGAELAPVGHRLVLRQ